MTKDPSTVCETDEQTILDALFLMQAVFKSVHQYFSSDVYLETKTMEFTSDAKIFSDFMVPETAGGRYYTPV